MEALSLLMQGFSVLLTWKILSLMLIGLLLGIFVGVLPGLGGPNGVAILLPLTFTMDPTSAIVPERSHKELFHVEAHRGVRLRKRELCGLSRFVPFVRISGLFFWTMICG